MAGQPAQGHLSGHRRKQFMGKLRNFLHAYRVILIKPSSKSPNFCQKVDNIDIVISVEAHGWPCVPQLAQH